MSLRLHEVEEVNRTKTVRFYPSVFTGEVPCKEVRTPLNSITFSEERDEETCYGYCDDHQPHAVRRMFNYKNGMLYDLRWDDAGNLGQVSMSKPGEMFERGRFLFWTEDCCGCEHRLCQSNVVSNRMHAAVDDKYFSYYVYDHSGERRLKLTGDSKLLDVNADFMSTYTILDNPTLYPSAYMVLTNKGYTKHYYAGTERVAARLGGGGLDALQHVIAIDDELQWRADKLFKQSLDHVNHRVLNENNLDCIMSNEFAKEEFGHPIEGIPYQMKADVEFNYGRFKDMVNSMLDDINHGQEKDVYFYHSDHLGSASWITDYRGMAVQHIQYLPYGEPYINQRPFGYSERFTFTGKERDEETGFGYFGARYMDHELMTMWLSVDPMADKYPSISPYAYCAWNPVKLVDPDGCEIDDYFTKEGKYLGSDNANTNYVRIISEVLWNSLKDENGNVNHDDANLVSHPFSEKSAYMSTEAQLEVYQHYNPTECKLYNLEPDGHYGMKSHFETGKEPIIFVRLEGNASGIKICDYADEIISCFAHEKGHVDLYRKLDSDVSKYKAISKDVREQIAVRAEMNNPSWNGTREVYKKDARRYGEKYGLKFNEKGELIQ